ncbi:hypothetical protein [Streptosporangium sp. NPDC003464]
MEENVGRRSRECDRRGRCHRAGVRRHVGVRHGRVSELRQVRGLPERGFYPVREITFKGRTLWLRNVRLTDYSYAYIKSGYRAGDLVTVHRSKNGGKTWKNCGPFTRDHSNQQPN